METLENVIVEEQATKEIEKAISTDQNAVPYTPMSKLPALGTVVPLNLAGETLQAQFDFTDEIPDIDQYLVDKLGYTSKLKLSECLAAEQADAVAMAIRQIEKDKAFILADMTGTGKGRVCAAIIRYAFVNDYLPIFITEKDNLFSAIYRDLVDIGGVETKPAGKPNLGLPLILNGFKSGGKEKTYDESGKKIVTEKPSQTGIVNAEGKEVISAPSQDEIKQIIKGDKVPKGYDYLMLTYSQISGERTGKQKLEYLMRVIEAKKGRVVLIADESHNAAGTKSSVGAAMTEIVSAVKGCLFSSATFSKRPDNMFIYSIKTDVSLSPLGTQKLIQVIKDGGERLTENLASNLVAAQQMIRREKTYDNCTVMYNYMDDSNKQELFGKYDATIKEYRKLQEFFASSLFVEAARNALKRFAEDNKVELAPPAPRKTEEFNDWVKANVGKYYRSSFTAGEIKRNQFQFIETLLFALKADFVANQALEQLLTLSKNVKVQGKEEFESNRKPVIAVRNTLEGIYYALGLEVGDTIDKADFSKYVYSLAMESMSGSVTLKEILIDDMKGGKKKEKDEKKKRKEVKGELEVMMKDFSDEGARFQQILKEIDEIDLDIPLSPIDYIINKIQSTKRASWDTYGVGEYFRVGEVTGRKFNLVKQEDGKYKLEINPKPKNKATTFKDFNNGLYDVLLINESGSTGEDAHSSSKFKDKRPRVMVIHQVELDVSTEVQKRGRINRTGMVNYPTYVYAVSRIPSEIRRLLMLVRKMRSLDANTTGNQKQSAKLSTIRDSFDNEIQDVINKYGDECLDEFIQSNPDYNRYMPTTDQEALGSLSGSFVIETFVRNLELSLSDEQEYFYNTINALYIQLKEKYGAEFDLETNILDLKAAIKTRVVVSKGENTNPFNTSVYEEDDYVLSEEKPYNAEKVEDLVLSLAMGKDPDEAFNDFLNDYDRHFREVHLVEVANNVSVPDYTLAKDEMEKKEMEAEYEMRKKSAQERAISEYSAVLAVFFAKVVEDKDGLPIGLRGEGGISDTGLNFKPRSAARIPAVIEECYETDEDGNPIPPKELNNAKFCGVKILKTAKEKYSPMNIELIFCQLSGKPKIILKPTAKGREVLEWVVVKSKDIPITSIKLIGNWEVDPNKRTLMRLFTGNILGAYGVAKDRVAKSNEYSPVVQFVKFTTADNTSIRLGVKITPRRYTTLTPQNVPVTYQLNSNMLLVDLAKSKYTSLRNAAENFFMVVRPNQDKVVLQVYILGGKATGDSKDPKKTKYYCFNKANDHNVYNDGQLRKMFEQPDFYNVYSPFGFYPFESSRMVRAKAIGFQAILPDKMSEIKKIFDYIYSVYPFNVELRGVESEETIYNKMDIFVPEEQEGEIEMVEGEFAYETTKPFVSIKSAIEAYPKFMKYERTSDFGTIFLNRKASVREAISYGLIPLDNTIVDMVTQTFQAIPNDSEKIKLNEDIKKAVQEDKSDYEIGKLVYTALVRKLNSIKVIFGPEGDDLNFIGDVFKRFEKGEIELPQKKQEEQKRERVVRPLDLETAQEFMWILSYKVKTN